MATSETTFTDAQITEACGLHVDNLRRMITWRAVKPAQSGGGRGRVRLWTLRQALRIAVTAEFFHAGFSLQMAHTITYCLPLDDMLTSYDLDYLRKYEALDDPDYHALVDPEKINPMPNKGFVGTETIIVNSRYIYSDALGDSPCLFAVIDKENNKLIPVWFSHKTTLWGVVLANDPEFYRDPDILAIDRGSLLVDEKYFEVPYEGLHAYTREIVGKVDTQIIEAERLNYRSLQTINLNVGLYIAFRKLLGIPVLYELSEMPDAVQTDIGDANDFDEHNGKPKPDEEK